ncbi:MAG: DUF3365 domain-containing protein [Deltaproteobacteria bacterium]|nr:DUF3365 domain-containing protein [Deltaproteobacteria bacterium]
MLVAAAVLMVWLVDDQMHRQTLLEAQEKSRLLLDRNLATHTYFSHQLKPKVFLLADKAAPPGYFEPAWMSSTYAVRGIDDHFQKLSDSNYYYKECAINARTPQNEADAHERSFIQELNADPKLQVRSQIREINGARYYEVLRRGEVMEQTCLRCHSTADQAPAEMVARYGSERSFHRREGEVVSAIAIRIPLEAAMAQGDRFTRTLAIGIAVVLAGLGVLVLWLNQRLFSRPLDRMRAETARIALGGEHLGESVPQDFPGEWNLLAQEFNTMSTELREIYDNLENKVTERTALLQKALDEVNTLSGLLPICANCKKIRDDQGYWHQVEVYIHDHSVAEFTHGICPECKEKLYGDLFDPDPGDEPEPRG